MDHCLDCTPPCHTKAPLPHSTCPSLHLHCQILMPACCARKGAATFSLLTPTYPHTLPTHCHALPRIGLASFSSCLLTWLRLRKVRDSNSLQLPPTYPHALPPATHQVCQVLIVPADVAETVQGCGLEVRRCAGCAHEACERVQHLLRDYRRRQLAAAGCDVAQALGKQAGREAPGVWGKTLVEG